MRKSGTTVKWLEADTATTVYVYAEAGSVLPEVLGENIVLVQE